MSQWSKRSRGRMELAAGDAVAAERALRESWDVLTQMGLQSSLGETAVPLAEALYAQGRLEEADSTLKALKEEWASDDASVNAPRLAVRAKLLAAEGWTRLAEETADRALRVVRPMDWLCLQVDALLAHADVMHVCRPPARRAREHGGGAAHRRGEGLRGGRDHGAPRGDPGLSRDFLDLPLRDFLAEVATPEPMPGAGYCAAVSLSMAAGLVAMVAGASRGEWGEARGAAAQANTLRERVAPLAQRNVDAYATRDRPAATRATSRPGRARGAHAWRGRPRDPARACGPDPAGDRPGRGRRRLAGRRRRGTRRAGDARRCRRRSTAGPGRSTHRGDPGRDQPRHHQHRRAGVRARDLAGSATAAAERALATLA